MTQREEFEKWFFENWFLKSATIGEKMLMLQAWQAAKSALLTLPDRMDYELHGDSVIDSHHNTFADGYNECLSDVIAMNEEYANSTGSDEWIPVSERLPMDGEKVLIFDKYCTYGSIYTLMYYDGFMLKHKGVTHWMPLPAAPEQQK